MSLSVTNESDYVKLLQSHDGSYVFINFWAPWCVPCKQMNVVFDTLATDHPEMVFLNIEAEEVPEIAERYEVEEVPMFVVLQSAEGKRRDQVLGSVMGAKARDLSKLVEEYAAKAKEEGAGGGGSGGSTSGSSSGNNEPEAEESAEKVQARIDRVVNSGKIVLVMKGTAEKPECKFSRKTVEILQDNGVAFSTYNILKDPNMRAEIKTYKNFGTFPQLYVGGELVGGADVVAQLNESEELGATIEQALTDAVRARIDKVVTQSDAVLLMKGTPEYPQCGFSNKAVNALNAAGIKYSSYDILSDPELRQEIKTYKNWMTFPQLYVHGELVGGCDIILEMAEEGELDGLLEE